jgi:hypothetical protein
MNHTLRLDWIGNSGEAWIDVVTFHVEGSKVTTMSTSANADGKIIRGGPRSWDAFRALSIQQARRMYRNCLNSGYKPVSQAPELTYYDQAPVLA